MYKFRGSKEYENGLDKLLDIAFEKESMNGKSFVRVKIANLVIG